MSPRAALWLARLARTAAILAVLFLVVRLGASIVRGTLGLGRAVMRPMAGIIEALGTLQGTPWPGLMFLTAVALFIVLLVRRRRREARADWTHPPRDDKHAP